jgi:hypothetical protein
MIDWMTGNKKDDIILFKMTDDKELKPTKQVEMNTDRKGVDENPQLDMPVEEKAVPPPGDPYLVGFAIKKNWGWYQIESEVLLLREKDLDGPTLIQNIIRATGLTNDDLENPKENEIIILSLCPVSRRFVSRTRDMRRVFQG